MTDDLRIINQMAFQIHYLSKMNLGNSLRSNYLIDDARNLMELINKEYDLKWDRMEY